MLNSVSNALRVLEYLVEAKEAGVSEIGRELGITVGTAHRLVGTLVDTGFAAQNPDSRRYVPGPKLLTLADRMRAREQVREVAHQHLTRLARRANETANLAVLRDDRVLYLDKVISEQPFGIEARIGSRLPAYCTALGKVLLGDLDEPELARYLARMPELARDEGDPPPPPAAALRREISRTAETGFGEDHGEYLPDVYCLAAPVRGPDSQVVGAMSISAPKSRFVARRDFFIECLRDAVAAASLALKERQPPPAAGDAPLTSR